MFFHCPPSFKKLIKLYTIAPVSQAKYMNNLAVILPADWVAASSPKGLGMGFYEQKEACA